MTLHFNLSIQLQTSQTANESHSFANLKMLQRFLKKNYWEEVGGVAGFHNAVEHLGSNWRLLDQEGQGFTKETSIWGQLAQVTDLKKKTCPKARKWLYSVWQEDRHGVRTKFYANQQAVDLATSLIDKRNQRDDTMAPIAEKVRELFFDSSTVYLLEMRRNEPMKILVCWRSSYLHIEEFDIK